jgi:hypothetical protein
LLYSENAALSIIHPSLKPNTAADGDDVAMLLLVILTMALVMRIIAN